MPLKPRSTRLRSYRSRSMLTAIHRAFAVLQNQGRVLQVMTVVAPLGILVSDALQSNGSVWHDLWEISTTVIGTLIVVLVRDYLSKQKELKKSIDELQKDRDNIEAHVGLAYAKELGMQKKRQDKIVEVMVQVVFKLYPEDAGSDLQKIVRELMDSGD